jgi:hypothetical protein
MKQLYLNFIMTLSCKLNCTYCTIPKSDRTSIEYLNDKTFKLKLFQCIKFFKDNNYDSLVISITGDELENLPNFLDYLEVMLTYMGKTVKGIPKENIKLKMHTNINATNEFYLTQFKLLEEAKCFCTPEFETVYQAMYHSMHRETRLRFIQKHIKDYDIDYLACVGLRNEDDRARINHLYSDLVFDFSNMPPREKFKDRELLSINIVRNDLVVSGCGFDLDQNLFKLEDADFCTECPNDSCMLLEDQNKI